MSCSNFPRKVTPYFESLATADLADPLLMQFEPSEDEETGLSYELEDPLGEEAYSPVSRLIHRYPSRALFLVTDTCAIHCRYCFRRRFAGGGTGSPTGEELDGTAGYLAAHPEIKEVLLSGGDPLTLSDGDLARVMTGLTAGRGNLIFRMCTRVPGAEPSRITKELCDTLTRDQPVWVVAQFNHPRELTPESTTAVARLIDVGIPVVSQTVLLRGINDNPETLADLFNGLLRCRVKPYYLFQADLARGTSHFRVPLLRGIDIVKKLRIMISNLAMPQFAVDIPGGGGKIPLDRSAIGGVENGWFSLSGPNGETGRYPDEDK
jgi:lysine 2,3-aminomutase